MSACRGGNEIASSAAAASAATTGAGGGRRAAAARRTGRRQPGSRGRAAARAARTHRAARRSRPRAGHGRPARAGRPSPSGTDASFTRPSPSAGRAGTAPSARRSRRESAYSDANGSSAMLRARLMASVSLRWCSAQVPNMRRGRTLPRSGTNGRRAASRPCSRCSRSCPRRTCRPCAAGRSSACPASLPPLAPAAPPRPPPGPPRPPPPPMPPPTAATATTEAHSTTSSGSTGGAGRGRAAAGRRRFASSATRARLAALGLAQLLVDAHGDELDDAVRHADAALDFLHQRGLALDGQQHVRALTVLVDDVGQALLAPLLDLVDACRLPSPHKPWTTVVRASTSGSPRLGSAMNRIS